MFNETISGVPVASMRPTGNYTVPCEVCYEAGATYAVGVADHNLVCDACLAWGDTRRWWNKEPRQRISWPKFRGL